MWKFWQLGLLYLAVIAISYLIFRYTLSGEWRHNIWEKYVHSFSMFVMILFVVTAAVNIGTYLILFRMGYKHYVNIVAPALASVIIGFTIASVPQRGVGDKSTGKISK
ncbi:hypothetical protein OXPF_35920 [Oxobacter pfennigii]|uniref:Uncharacterized protein n=1 Tax=Oxobacter pfennigii TaxID=36849 RepID=A0A0P8W4T7_9CLOT|nr:hypothetical protein [Oxobacter pfennigii]KPU42828.1 hypothetical protein OXPF_35920 [Oxobacter pfennigii]